MSCVLNLNSSIKMFLFPLELKYVLLSRLWLPRRALEPQPRHSGQSRLCQHERRRRRLAFPLGLCWYSSHHLPLTLSPPQAGFFLLIYPILVDKQAIECYTTPHEITFAYHSHYFGSYRSHNVLAFQTQHRQT